jgi:ABC-2 type transport system ATP-binding protein
VITAMLTEPDVLVLDEPYQGMDAESTRRFWALLSSFCAGGGAAIVSTHQTDALSRAHTVLELGGDRTWS